MPFRSSFAPGSAADTSDPAYEKGLEMIAYYYNDSIARHGKQDCVYLQKDPRPEIYRVGTLDVEKSQLPGVSP